MIAFQLLAQAGELVGPRRGRLITSRGTVETPVFMPVGTLAAVKTLLPEEVESAGAEMILVNAYHLYLRPGHRLIEQFGGVHRFMGWSRPILSDSGGFQGFSLARLVRVDDDGVRFRSHIDGSEHFYTPELAIEVQRALGVDIAMPLDHVVPAGTPEAETREAAERPLRWFERCRRAAGTMPVFAIVQGGVDAELRRWHARALAALDAPGYAIGGLSVGEPKAAMWRTLEVTCAELPPEKPRYLMGVGSPEDIVEAVARGVDMFDCVLPTRLGRNGGLFTDEGRVNIRAARFAEADAPVDPDCDCLACRRFPAAYLHHLFRNEEMLGYRLATIHNLRYLARLIGRIRCAIEEGRFQEFAAAFQARYRPTDESVRAAQREKWLERRARASGP